MQQQREHHQCTTLDATLSLCICMHAADSALLLLTLPPLPGD